MSTRVTRETSLAHGTSATGIVRVTREAAFAHGTSATGIPRVTRMAVVAYGSPEGDYGGARSYGLII